MRGLNILIKKLVYWALMAKFFTYMIINFKKFKRLKENLLNIILMRFLKVQNVILKFWEKRMCILMRPILLCQIIRAL